MTADGTSDAKGTGAYAEVNGINLYYETHGAGRPMVLLHGGLGSGEMFGPILPALAERHQVIVADLQGHGRTADIDRPIDVRLMADDIAALIDHLGLERPDVVGYSLGGGVAFFVAVEVPGQGRPARRGLGAHPARRDPPEMLAQQAQVNAAAAEFMKDTPMYQLYQRVAPRPEDFRTAAGQDRRVDGEGLRLQRGGPRPPGADADRRRRRRHGAAEPLRRGLQAARRRPARRRLDGRGPAEGRSRARDPARPDPLQPRHLAAASPRSSSTSSTGSRGGSALDRAGRQTTTRR